MKVFILKMSLNIYNIVCERRPLSMVELLAPAGSLESFYASINAGADALYLGGKLFSARAYASNFSNEELEKMIIYAHKRNVKVYITVNTIIFEEEFPKVVEFVSFLHSRNVDGILLQDLGLASYLHEVFPDLVLHASTQLNCHNVAEAKALMDVGFKRLVLARETPLEVTKQIKDLGVEVEVFVHGALCVSYSGQCLMSSFIGNRSGNRGRCAQPCRNNMICKNDEDSSSPFALSMKDLCTISDIESLIDAGVDSLKIEGRMKREEYVYEVVSSYRDAIDSLKDNLPLDVETKISNMKKLFNREFTKGFILNTSKTKTLNQKTSSHIGSHLGKVTSISKNYAFIKLDDDLMINDGIRINNRKQEGQVVQKMFVDSIDVKKARKGDLVKILLYGIHPQINDEVIKTTSSAQIEEIDQKMKVAKKVPLNITLKAYIGSPLMMEIVHKEVIVNVVSNFICEASNKGNLDLSKLKNQVDRLGNSEYELNEFIYDGAENAFIPSSIINELRRDGLEQIEEKINDYYKINENIKVLPYKAKVVSKEQEFSLSCQVENEEQLNIALMYPFKKIYINNKRLYSYYKDEERVRLVLPRINEKDTEEVNDNQVTSYIKKVPEGKVGVVASSYMNAVNSYMLDFLYSHHYEEVSLSYELDKNRIQKMMEGYYSRHGSYPYVSIPLYGYVDLMIIKSCPIATMYGKENDHCGMCHKYHYTLEDRKNVSFEMMHDEECRTRILNSLPIYLSDYLEQIISLHISEGVLVFTNENEDVVNKISTDAFNKLTLKTSNIPLEKYTRGHFNREIE
jgi:putative protease